MRSFFNFYHQSVVDHFPLNRATSILIRGDYQSFVVTAKKNFMAACNIVIFDEEKCLHKVALYHLYLNVQTLMDLTFKTVNILIFFLSNNKMFEQILLLVLIKKNYY